MVFLVPPRPMRRRRSLATLRGVGTSFVTLSSGLAAAAESLTSPLLPDDYLGMVNPLWSGRQISGRVTAVTAETADATTLTIQPGRGWRSHQAGQWVRVSVEIDGTWQSRTYSITSAADRRAGRFTITVKAIEDGRVSPYLAHHTRPGTVLRLDLPQGDFGQPGTPPGDVPARPRQRRQLLLTAGSGITPVMGILRTLDARGPLPATTHVHCARHADDVIFGAELRALQETRAEYRLHEHHSDADGWFRLDSLDDICPDWREREVWACGPRALLDAVEKHWADAGLTDQLHVERFQAPVFAAPDAAGGTVSFTKSGRDDVDAPAGRPLLEVGEAAGVTMPQGCRMGICFSCVAPLRSGQVRDLRTGEIHGDEGDLIQTCVSAAAGPCSIDL